MPDRLAAAMQELYAAHPDDFMAVRRRLAAEAKADGEGSVAGEIGKLRKPSIAAWALNLTARVEPEPVERLVDLGTRMRAAQSRLDAATLTGLRPERDALLSELVGTAEAVVADAGRRLTPAAAQDVRGTLIAALADEEAARAVSSGQLTRALSYSGFGEVDVSEAVARTSSGSILTVLPGAAGAGARRAGTPRGGATGSAVDEGGGEEDREEGGGGEGSGPPDLAELTRALDTAQRELDEAESAVTRARERAEETRERLGVVERQLAKAREADERALEAVTDAVRARKAAEAARHTAAQALAHAQEDG